MICEICERPKVYKTGLSEQTDEKFGDWECDNPYCGKVRVPCQECLGKGYILIKHEKHSMFDRKLFCWKCLGKGKVWVETEKHDASEIVVNYD